MSESNKTGSTAASAGLSMGSALAMIISWSESHSVVWAVVHGVLGWLYVIWYAVWGR